MMNLLKFCRDNKVSALIEYNTELMVWVIKIRYQDKILKRVISPYELEYAPDPDGIIKILLEHMLTELNKGTV